MRPQMQTLAPVVKENGGIRLSDKGVKTLCIGADVYGVPIFFQEQGGAQAKGSHIAVDQRKLLFQVPDQCFRVGLLTEQDQGVVQGNPATAGFRGGTEPVAPLFPGNLGLVQNQLTHGWDAPQ